MKCAKYICPVTFFIVFISRSTQAFAQRFNTDAVTKFWKLVDHLKTDQPLTDSLWNDYYNLKGNKAYMESNRDIAQAAEHRKYLEIVFRPSNAGILNTLEKLKPDPTDDILKNLLYIRSHEQELREYTPQIISPDYLITCLNLAKNDLPINKVKRVPKDLTIYIHAMTFDAAVQPPNMYFGLAIIYEFDRFEKGAIAAHEFQHQLRVNKEISHVVSQADSTSFSIINQVNNEGTADLIDKTVVMKHREALYEAEPLIHWLFDDAPRVIKQLDSCFLVNADVSAKHLSNGDFRKITLFSSGHIPGFYMAYIIIRNGGRQQLIAHSDNPFNIFYLYNRLAKKSKGHPVLFSNKNLIYLRQLEKKVYGTKN